jgi:4-carboxymuconolactone decarboxylase
MLGGPSAYLLHAPDVALRYYELGQVLKHHTTLGRDLVELAIVTTVRNHGAAYQFGEHLRLALAAGVPAEVVEGLRNGVDVSSLLDERGRVVCRVADLLSRTFGLDDDTYDHARAQLGDVGLTELCALVGYYAMSSTVGNAHRIGADRPSTPSTT